MQNSSMEMELARSVTAYFFRPSIPAVFLSITPFHPRCLTSALLVVKGEGGHRRLGAVSDGLHDASRVRGVMYSYHENEST